MIATPEMVTFEYQLAGPGSRFLAQLIDFPVQIGLLALAIVGGIGTAGLTGNSNAGLLAGLILGFLSVWGYYPVSEGVWSGRTLGKYAIGLRVVGDDGAPITVGQALLRNLVRLVDFLPMAYGVGIVALFVNGRGKRLGDLVAGTVVVRERAPVRLDQLTGAATMPSGETLSLAPAEAALLRALSPDLRRLVVAYSVRRHTLDPWWRQVIAARLTDSLRHLQPDLVATQGPLAALDRLADLVGRPAT